jgi:Spy/CpxP family protein refolding chaperone
MTGRTWLLAASLLFNAAFAASYGYAWFTGPHAAAIPTASAAETMESDALPQAAGMDPSQAAAFRSSRQALMEEVRRLRSQIRQDKDRMWTLVTSPSSSPESIREVQAAMAERQQRIQVLLVDQVQRTRQSLSPQQRERLDQYVRSRMCTCASCDGACLGGECAASGGRAPACHGEDNPGQRSACGCGGAATEGASPGHAHDAKPCPHH